MKTVGAFELLNRKCVVCGKEFIATSEYVYRRKNLWMCGWNCLCKYEKNPEFYKESAEQKDGK